MHGEQNKRLIPYVLHILKTNMIIFVYNYRLKHLALFVVISKHLVFDKVFRDSTRLI